MTVVLKSTGWMHTPGVVRWAVNQYRFGNAKDKACMENILLSMFPSEFGALKARLTVKTLLRATPAQLEEMINEKGGTVTVII